MGEIKKLIRICNTRNISPSSKVTIIKLSLPRPNVFCFKELNATFANSLWCGKPPKSRKEILEGEIHHGGLKLHNLPFFDIVLHDFDLSEVFIYGYDYLEKNL